MDPNSIVGNPTEREVWLAPDWSTYKPITASQPRGYARVSVRETTYADGRIVTHVLDENRQPITRQILDQQMDPEQEKRWKEQQNQSQPPGGIPTRTINGQVFNWNPATRAYDIPTGQAPAATATQAAAPGGKPFIDDGFEARENGRRWGWNEQTRLYDRDLGPSPTAQEIIRNRSLPADQDPRAETDAERAARTKENEARAARPGTKIRERTEIKDGRRVTVETWRLPDGREEERTSEEITQPDRVGKPTGNTRTRNENGQTVKEAEYVLADGTREWRSQTAPNLDNPTTPGPSMPQIVLGMSQDAARQYKGELQAGVAAGRWSQAWADARWKEFMETANLAVQEAATQQRERESTRNADIKLATSRANLGQNAISQAAGVVDKINGLLPEGSPLGGQAFAAMLGINMLMQARSGIDTIDPSGRRPATPSQPALAPITPAEIANPAALATRRAEIMANPVFRPQPPVNAAPAAGPSAPGDSGVSPGSQGAPRPGAAPVGIVTPGAALPPNRPDQTQAAAQIEDAIMPPAEAPGQDFVFSPVPGTQVPNMKQDTPPRVGPSVNPDGTPDYGAPGMRVLPPPPSTVSPLPPNEVSMAPYPVLAQYQQPTMGAPAMPTRQSQEPTPQYPVLAQYQPSTASASAPAVQPQYPAALQSAAASRAPWQMSPEEIEQYMAAGVPEDVIWSVPGRSAA